MSRWGTDRDDLAVEGPIERRRYRPPPRPRGAATSWKQYDYESAPSIKARIKTAILKNLRISSRELMTKFGDEIGISMVCMSMIRSEFLADLKFLKRMGVLRNVEI